MRNLHIVLNNFNYSSRIQKELNSLKKLNKVDEIYVAAIFEEGLNQHEKLSENVYLNRIYLNTKKLPNNFIFQTIKYLEFFVKIFFKYKNESIRVINIHSLALLPIGVALKLILKAKLIYDIHELETETEYLRGFRKKISKILERELIRYVDRIICVSKSISKWYFDKYNLSYMPDVIINSPECSNHNSIKPNVFRDKYKISKETRICIYQGAFFKGRGIELILETFENIESDNYAVVFMGYGPLKSQILNSSRINKNIFYHPAVSRDNLPHYTKSADIGLNLIEKTCLSYEYSLSNKFFEYASVGIPIISSNCPEYFYLIGKYSSGIILEDNSAECLMQCLNNIYDNQLLKFGSNALRMFEENCWQKQESIYNSIYSRI